MGKHLSSEWDHLYLVRDEEVQDDTLGSILLKIKQWDCGILVSYNNSTSDGTLVTEDCVENIHVLNAKVAGIVDGFNVTLFELSDELFKFVHLTIIKHLGFVVGLNKLNLSEINPDLFWWQIY